jgi:solute carrier family 45 protein 1/2/4
VQAVDRALLVDMLPASDQARASAWAAQMGGIGNVAGFFVANINLPRIFPFLGKAQLEVLSVIASVLLLSTHLLTAYSVKERVLVSSVHPTKGFRSELKTLFNNMFTLPRVIRQICFIQFFAWIAWFPVLFYTTTYIGELHKRASPAPTDDDAALALDAEATRLGSRALFYSSILSLAMNLLLPFIVSEAAGKGEKRSAKPAWWQVHMPSLWASSHLVFAGCMFGTLLTSSVFGASILMTITGFSWAITTWAPFSLLSEAILTEPASDDAGSIRLVDARTADAVDDERQHFLVGDGDDDDENSSIVDVTHDDGLRSRSPSLDRRPGLMGNPGAQRSHVDLNGHDGDFGRQERKVANGGLAAKAGIILVCTSSKVLLDHTHVCHRVSTIYSS